MRTQPETKMGPGAPTPEPRCIAYSAFALSPYAFRVIEGNQNAVRLALQREGGGCVAILIDPAQEQAEAPENAL